MAAVSCINNEVGQYDYEEHSFIIKNTGETYTYGSIFVPDTKNKYPLVFIAHGFKGTMNSGGAEELSRKLARNGIAAVRIDFNSRYENYVDSDKTNEYTLLDMTSNAVLAVDYAVKNYNIDSDRIGLYGRSMGGRAVMIMANESMGYDYKAMVLVAPAGNDNAMIYYMGGTDKWGSMKKEACNDGFVVKQGLKLTPEWFTQFEEYNPSKTGGNFGNKPVLVFYNTLDNVVLPETSLECASGYRNCEVIKVTTNDGHGYEMGYKESEIKDMIMDKIIEHFKGALCTN